MNYYKLTKWQNKSRCLWNFQQLLMIRLHDSTGWRPYDIAESFSWVHILSECCGPTWKSSTAESFKQTTCRVSEDNRGIKASEWQNRKWNWWCGKIQLAVVCMCVCVCVCVCAASVCVQRKSWCWLIKLKNRFTAELLSAVEHDQDSLLQGQFTLSSSWWYKVLLSSS